MKKLQIAYCKIQNMGDLLNELLMERVFQVPFVHSTNLLIYDLTGIGSFMDSLFEKKTHHSEPNNLKRVIGRFARNHCITECHTWGTGFISDLSKECIGLNRNKVDFMAVRGKKTKACIEKIINKEINPVFGDAGILAPYLFEKPIKKEHEIGIIPHFKEQNCQRIQILTDKFKNSCVIDLKGEPLEVVRNIAKCEYIISSSLHGLIVADAFRIPNVRVYFTDAPMGDGFKYDDYYSAYDLNVPARIIANHADEISVEKIISEYRITDLMVKNMQNDMFNCLDQYIKER